MNLNKQLFINNQKIKIVNEDIRLNLFSPGVAAFTVQSSTQLKGIVSFSLGYDIKKIQQFFTGFIESSTPIDNQQQRLFCRELGATLNQRIPLALQHPTLNTVLSTIASETGLRFITPGESYAKEKASRFYSVSNGYHAFKSMADVFKIPQFIWQQQGDNKIFVGSWQHSYWKDKNIDIPLKWMNNTGVANRAKIPALPKLRPGVLINNKYLTALQLADNHMYLTWNKNPWRNRYGNRN